MRIVKQIKHSPGHDIKIYLGVKTKVERFFFFRKPGSWTKFLSAFFRSRNNIYE